jgi:hemerythrin superfamily protein
MTVPNGIDLILADHRAVEELFAAFDDTQDGGVIGQVVDMLAAHDDAEHGVLYPFAAAFIKNTAVLDRAALAHTAVKQQIEHLMAQEGDPLVDAFTALRRLVQNHVKDEEKNLLPALAKAASDAELDTLGARILQAKQRVG